MSNLIFEILTEDISYLIQTSLEQEIKALIVDEFSKSYVDYKTIISSSSPRRLAFEIAEINNVIPDITIDKKGPPVSAGEKTLQAFLNGYNITSANSYIKSLDKGDFYFGKIIIKGGDLKHKLPDIMSKVLTSTKLHKLISWNDSLVKWARPIRGLLFMLNDHPIKFNFAGVEASNKLMGHRFLGDIRSTNLNDAKNYQQELKSLHVIARSGLHEKFEDESRKSIILNACTAFAQKHDLAFNNSKDLINELVYLVEYPVIMFGKINKVYLNLPPELIIHVMAKAQRYINFYHKKNQSLSPNFAIVSNIKGANNGEDIIKGNERVLRARLDDAWFFYGEDLKTSLYSKMEGLKDIQFFEGLGSIFDKKERVKVLAQKIFQNEDLSPLIDLYKADLSSLVVQELPDLQGIMGQHYALKEGVPEYVAAAVGEHYLPLGKSDKTPSTLLGCKLALLDKLDTIISFHKINKLPTSSGDPFGIRRSILGIIRISIASNITNQAEYTQLRKSLNINLSQIIPQPLIALFTERLEIYVKNTLSINPTITRAVLLHNKHQFKLITIYEKIIAINEYIAKNPSFISFYKRIFNIIEKNSNLIIDDKIDEAFFIKKSEQSLLAAFYQTNQIFTDNLKKELYTASLESINSLQSYISEFLDEVLLIEKDKPLATSSKLLLFKKILLNLQKLAYFEIISI